jgi:hypothetical protein
VVGPPRPAVAAAFTWARAHGHLIAAAAAAARQCARACSAVHRWGGGRPATRGGRGDTVVDGGWVGATCRRRGGRRVGPPRRRRLGSGRGGAGQSAWRWSAGGTSRLPPRGAHVSVRRRRRSVRFGSNDVGPAGVLPVLRRFPISIYTEECSAQHSSSRFCRLLICS